MSILALLPVRNSAEHLPRYFRSAQVFADGVLALDDGSTDDTRSILESQASVRVILSNPRRDSYHGWNDFENRQRLLDAAAAFHPDWIVFLDADESFPDDEAAALRTLLRSMASGDLAFGFRVYRMLDENGSFDKEGQWVHRAFRYRPNQRLPKRKLHFPTVPPSIPKEYWIKTTLRIQHYAGTTEARRLARYRKYLEADPNRVYQDSYENILDPPGRIRRWIPRQPSDPFLLAPLETTTEVLGALPHLCVLRLNDNSLEIDHTKKPPHGEIRIPEMEQLAALYRKAITGKDMTSAAVAENAALRLAHGEATIR